MRYPGDREIIEDPRPAIAESVRPAVDALYHVALNQYLASLDDPGQTAEKRLEILRDLVVSATELLAPVSDAKLYGSLDQYRTAYVQAAETALRLAHFVYQQAHPLGRMMWLEQHVIERHLEDKAFRPRDRVWAKTNAQPYSPVPVSPADDPSGYSRAPETAWARKVETFVAAVNQVSRTLEPTEVFGADDRITKKDVSNVAGYRDQTELMAYQRGDWRKCGPTAKKAIERVLNMTPMEFMKKRAVLLKKNDWRWRQDKPGKHS